ncbi:MAG: hypothetical protein K6C14_01830 [Eubacterium sp.]|nr:hypothetical protein [Eubacterium sp.]
MTEKEKARRRFFASENEATDFIPQCAVCKNVDGVNCMALKGRRPEKYYMDDNPEFCKCPHFSINKKAHLYNEYISRK